MHGEVLEHVFDELHVLLCCACYSSELNDHVQLDTQVGHTKQYDLANALIRRLEIVFGGLLPCHIEVVIYVSFIFCTLVEMKGETPTQR